ncbi:MAG: hypothetical protein OWS74_07960 [Firmicutes bacterium]|nr:hypothetical protein [Bacillota bacterium]
MSTLIESTLAAQATSPTLPSDMPVEVVFIPNLIDNDSIASRQKARQMRRERKAERLFTRAFTLSLGFIVLYVLWRTPWGPAAVEKVIQLGGRL